MTWTKLSDEFLEDETVVDLSDRAYRLNVSGMVYSSRQLTDGWITEKQLRVVQAILGFKVARYAAELVDSGLWTLDDISGAYRIKNFLKYNPTAGEVKAERARNAKRQREWRERHRADNAPTNDDGNSQRNALRNGVSNGAPTRPVERTTNSKGFTGTYPAEKPSNFTIPNLREVS